MHFCSNCHRAVLDDVPYCPSCGAAQSVPAGTDAPNIPASPVAPNPQPQYSQNPVSPPPFPNSPVQSYPPPPMQEQSIPQRSLKHRKSPMTSAVLNFFLPGFGYVYNGIGIDTSQVIFGILCFLALFLGLFVPSVVEVLFTGTSSSATGGQGITPADFLTILVLLIPFALAYDGYKRAIKINNESAPQPI